MPLDLLLVSAEEELFSGESDFIAARTVAGDIGILPGHTPLLARLVEYDIRVKTADSEQTFPIAGGFMTVKDDKVIILAEEKEESPETA